MGNTIKTCYYFYSERYYFYYKKLNYVSNEEIRIMGKGISLSIYDQTIWEELTESLIVELSLYRLHSPLFLLCRQQQKHHLFPEQ